jgi:hypothetical protein
LKDERGSWYLLTGLVLGLSIGLVFAWVISPRAFGDSSPALLRADFKDSYRAMIAVAFSANGNLPRAQARLRLLGDPDIVQAVSGQAARMAAQGSSTHEAQALERLALALSAPSTDLPPATVVSVSPSPASATPSLPVPTASPSGLFSLTGRTLICDQELSRPMIQVLARDRNGEQLSAVEVIVKWEGGEDHFFTGLKPEIGLGYADFHITPGTAYTLQLASGEQLVSELASSECEAEDGSRFWGSWLLEFTRQ